MASSQLSGEEPIRSTVVGGSDAAYSDYPWMVALVYSDDESDVEGQFCGGVLVDPNWVLTAAHCVDDLERDEFLIVGGNSALEDMPIRRSPRGIFFHPDTSFVRINRSSDLALIQLMEPITEVEPVSINRALNKLEAGERARVIGWGRLSYDEDNRTRSSKLQETDVTLKAIYNYPENHPVPRNFIMTEDLEPITGTNRGDSGGPLLVRADDGERWELAGVTSSGVRSIENDLNLGFYANAFKSIDWVQGLINPLYSELNPTRTERVSFGHRFNGKDYAGYRIWPFANRVREDLRLSRGWGGVDWSFDMNDLDLLRYNGDGSFTVLHELGDAPYDNTSIAVFESESSDFSGAGLRVLHPFEDFSNISLEEHFSFNRFTSLWVLDDLEVGTEYRIRNVGSGRSWFRVFEVGNGSLTQIIGRYARDDESRFLVSEGKEYWMESRIVRNWFEELFRIVLRPSVVHTFGAGETLRATLSSDSHPYRNEHTRVDLIKYDERRYDEVEIKLYSDFDSEISVYSEQTGKLVAYTDIASEFDTDTLIVNAENLVNGIIHVFNFDADLFGDYELSVHPHQSRGKALNFGSSRHEAITSHDDSWTSDDGHVNRYQEFELTNELFREITVSVNGHYFDASIVVYDSSNEFIASEIRQDPCVLTFEAVPGEKYDILVIDFDELRDRNFEIEASGRDPDYEGERITVNQKPTSEAQPRKETDEFYRSRPNGERRKFDLSGLALRR